MNRFEKKYDRHVKKIQALRDQLKQAPDNQEIVAQIRQEEDTLFNYVLNSSKELETFLREQ